MLTTVELEAATKAVVYPRSPRTHQDLMDYRAEIAALEAQWKAWLASEYASDLKQAAQDGIFRMAWEEGHSSGYSNVEYQYEDLAALVRLAL